MHVMIFPLFVANFDLFQRHENPGWALEQTPTKKLKPELLIGVEALQNLAGLVVEPSPGYCAQREDDNRHRQNHYKQCEAFFEHDAHSYSILRTTVIKNSRLATKAKARRHSITMRAILSPMFSVDPLAFCSHLAALLGFGETEGCFGPFVWVTTTLKSLANRQLTQTMAD
jgi:hypothetical protein